MSVQVVFETHSTSRDNEQGFATGWLGGTLSSVGRDQARLLGRRRRNDGLDIVMASDLHRAVQTAHVAFGDTGIPVHLDWRLRECDYGAMNGMPRSQLDAERQLRLNEPFPRGESWSAAVERVTLFLDELLEARQGRRVLLIGHVATRWALDHRVHGKSLEELVVAPFEWREGWEYTLSE